MYRLAWIASLLLCLSAAGVMPANAQLPAIAGPADIGRGTLAMNIAGRMLAAPTLETRFEVSIGGMLARTRLQQSFRNNTGEWVEGIYLFPLPDGAQVDHLELIIGGRRIRGEIRERSQARAEYEVARDQGQRAGLVESERPNLFTTNVANIGPGEEVSIAIAWQQSIRYDAGLFSMRLPLVAGPRYIPPEDLAADPPAAARIMQESLSSTPVNPVHISVRLDAGMAITDVRSLYHSVTHRVINSASRELELAELSVPADRDFVLQWRSAATAPVTAMFREWHAGSEYALLQFFPPYGLTAPQLPRDIVFVIDTSGSMDGTSIEQAREALLLALGQLNNADRFNIIRFSSDTQLLHGRPVPALSNELINARQFVAHLSSGGGTEMFPALNAALQQFTDSDRSRVRQIVFMTDGNVGNERALFDLIRAQLGDARLYTVGIGSAPNSYFMASAARYGRGTHTFIGDVSEVSERMTALFEKISAPVLTNIEIEWPDDVVREVYPKRLTDLFAGEPLLVSMHGRLPPSFTIRGQMAGSPWSKTVQSATAAEQPGIGRLWAANRISSLLEQPHQRKPGDLIYDAVVATALEHGIVSRYTSLLAVEQVAARAAGQPLTRRQVPVNVPAGWRAAGIGGRLPGTATSAAFYLAVGLSLLLLACSALLLTRRQQCSG